MILLPLRSLWSAGLLTLASVLLTACGGSASDTSASSGAQTRTSDVTSGNTVSAMDRWAQFNAAGGVLPPQSEDDLTETQMGHAARLSAAELDTKRQQVLRTGGTAKSVLQRKSYVDEMLVYRFYNQTTGAHFFTGSTVERDNIIATMPQFQFEGVAFVVSHTPQPGLAPVYRFYNTSTGVHFYTISEDEKAYILATLPSYRLEGIAYYASPTPGAGLKPLFRFFRLGVKTHFYSGSVDERDTVIETNCDYRYEGEAYYVIDPAASGSTPAAHVNDTVLLIGDSLTQGYGYGVTGEWFSFVSPGQVWSQTLATAIPSRTGHGCNRLVDVSLGGMMTHHGVERIAGWLDRYWPTHVILAQGTNDAWQGVDMNEIRGNLGTMAQASRALNAHLFVMDFAFYPNGTAYRQALTAMYQSVAATYQGAYIQGTGYLPLSSTYYFPDTVHLRDVAQPMIRETVWTALQPFL